MNEWVRKDLTDDRAAAAEAARQASVAKRADRAAGGSLLALREQIHDKPSPPDQPIDDDVRRDILEAQPHLMLQPGK